MKMKNIVFLYFLLTSFPLMSQVDEQDQILAARNRMALKNYLEKIEPNGLLLNAKNYYKSYPQTAGHQYYESKTYSSSLLYLDGLMFKNIPLNYDVLNQELVTLIYMDNTVRYLIIDQRRVNRFVINEGLFVYLQRDEVTGLNTGIYEESFKHGEVRLLIRRIKERSKMAQTNYAKYRFRFNRKDEYYVTGSWGSKRIESKKDLFEVLPDKAKVEKIIDQNNLKLRANQASFLKELRQLLEEVYND